MYSDTALFTRNTAACPNKLKPRFTPNAGKSGLLDHAGGGLLDHNNLLPADVAARLNQLSSNLTTQVDVVTNKINALNAVAPSPAL